jgi:DNA-directed RNA polymerase beta subunit
MGVFCPAETPEGHNVGFVKNMSIGALVTVATDTGDRTDHAELD